MSYKLHLGQKTGFRILRPEREVIIRDSRGLLFYTTEFKTPNVKEFNLPAGDFLIDSGVFKSMAFPVDYPLMTLPPKERNRPIPNDFKIVYGRNPNKCSIIWPEKKILFDSALLDYTTPERDFIKFHEFSHAHYVTEKYCDLKAANYMILKGYNPIQIGLSQIDSLSSKQAERKEFLVNMLCKTYSKYL
jgi:hypothetical protein